MTCPLARLSPTMPLDYKTKRIYSLWDLSPGIQLFDYMHSNKSQTIYFLFDGFSQFREARLYRRKLSRGKVWLCEKESEPSIGYLCIDRHSTIYDLCM